MSGFYGFQTDELPAWEEEALRAEEELRSAAPDDELSAEDIAALEAAIAQPDLGPYTFDEFEALIFE